MPAFFSVLDSHVDLWMNGRDAPPLTFFGGPDRRSYSLVARFAPGVTVSAFAARAQDALRALVPDKQAGNWQVHVGSLRDRLAGNARTTLVIFLIASFLILLVASANAAMLFVNGVMARESDLAVRMALGASRARVIRVELLQTACLTAAATTAGWGLALAAVRVLGSLTGLDLPALATRATTGPVTAGAILAAAFVGVVCGTVQVAAIRDARLATALRSSRSSAGRGSRRLRGALVIVQMATATVLLTGTGLLGRTLLVLAGTDVGLDGTDRVLTLSVPLNDSATARDDAARRVLAGRLVDEARALPGVTSAGMGGALPPATAQLAFTVRYVTDTEDRTTRFDVVSASDGYLEALGARLVRGRLFEPRDEQGGEFVTVVSESALRHLGLSFDDLDKPLNMALPSASGEPIKPRLVGVVGDIRYTGLDAPTTGSLYVLSRQIPLNRAYLLVRTSRDVRTIAPEVSRLVRRADPSLPVGTSESLGAAIDRTLSSRSARFALVAVFAGTAVLLVLAGLSAAFVRSVAERERELAIRAAVGATPERLLRSVLTRGLMLAGVGAGIGVLGALAGARFVASAVYGVTPYDPPTYVAAVACIVIVALIAAWLPARRAAQADPVALLRSE